MPPLDSTPRGDEMVRRLPERKFPEPKPVRVGEDGEMGRTPIVSEHAADVGGTGAGSGDDIASRPQLPSQPQQMAADIEDEEDDPVVDSGPGIADGVDAMKESLRREGGGTK